MSIANDDYCLLDSIGVGALDMSGSKSYVNKEQLISLIRNNDLTENQLAQLKVQVEKFIDRNK